MATPSPRPRPTRSPGGSSRSRPSSRPRRRSRTPARCSSRSRGRGRRRSRSPCPRAARRGARPPAAGRIEPAPARAGVLRAPDGRLAVGHPAPVPGVERDDVEAVAVVRVRGGGEAELGRQAVGDLDPGLPGVVAAVHADVVLLVQAVVVDRRHHELVHAVADLGVLERPVGAQAAVARRPRPAVVGRLEDAEALDDRPEARRRRPGARAGPACRDARAAGSTGCSRHRARAGRRAC